MHHLLEEVRACWNDIISPQKVMCTPDGALFPFNPVVMMDAQLDGDECKSDTTKNVSSSPSRSVIEAEKHTIPSLFKRSNVFEDLGDSNRFENLDIETYDVENFYHEKGICQEVAKSEYFKNIVLGVIVENAVYWGIEVEHGNNTDEEGRWVYTLFDNMFCIFFILEIFVRFFLHSLRKSMLLETDDSNLISSCWF